MGTFRTKKRQNTAIREISRISQHLTITSSRRATARMPGETENKETAKTSDEEKRPFSFRTEAQEEESTGSKTEGEEKEHDPYYPPVITLPEVCVSTGEENEEEIFKMRAKLYRYDAGDGTEDNEAQWKERGTGDCKLLKHEKTGFIRFVMRREKTLKLCANHIVQSWMELKPNCGSDKAFVWSVHADYADEEPKAEVLAIKFKNAENAAKFRAAFASAMKEMTALQAEAYKQRETVDKDLASELEKKAEIAEK